MAYTHSMVFNHNLFPIITINISKYSKTTNRGGGHLYNDMYTIHGFHHNIFHII